MEEEMNIDDTKQKMSDMAMVEEEIQCLKSRLISLRELAEEVLTTIIRGTVDNSIAESDKERKAGDTRFEEMRLKLKSDCNQTLCKDISDALMKINDLIKLE